MSAVEGLLLIERALTSDSMKEERKDKQQEKRQRERVLIDFAYPSVLACGPGAMGTSPCSGHTIFLCLFIIKRPGFGRSFLTKIHRENYIGAHLQELALPVF